MELTAEQKFRRAKEQQAFPVNVYEGKWNDGMTLRDYFAAKALQGFVSAAMPDFTFETYARWSYKLADAMLKARDAE